MRLLQLNKTLFLFLITLILLFSCRSIRHTETVLLNKPSIKDHFKRTLKKPSKKRTYDLLHTKLKLNLDLEKEQLVGALEDAATDLQKRSDEIDVDIKKVSN